MFTPNSILRGLLIAASLSTVAFAQTTQGHYGFGTNVDPQDLAKYVTVQPDGTGLAAKQILYRLLNEILKTRVFFKNDLK